MWVVDGGSDARLQPEFFQREMVSDIHVDLQ
jgi:hypothetical protein